MFDTGFKWLKLYQIICKMEHESTSDHVALTQGNLAEGTLPVFTITNEKGAALPNTGGPGTRIFTILGSMLICLAGALLVRRRRLI